MSKFSRLIVVALILFAAFLIPLQAQEANKDILGAMRYRYIGPMGNRVTSVVSVPGQPNLYYVGAASGGREPLPGWSERPPLRTRPSPVEARTRSGWLGPPVWTASSTR